MTQSNHEFIKELFLDLNKKVEDYQARTETKIDNLELRLFTEIKEYTGSINSRFSDQEINMLECKHKINVHEGHFNTIKILFTSGVASLIGIVTFFYNLLPPHHK